MRLRVLPLLFGAALMMAGEDPFEAPPEMQAFARQHTNIQQGVPAKVSALLKAFFSPPEEGGLGITYDNAYTRTPKEVWRDRKANCLSLTALYVVACKSIGLEARYGEPLRISRWRRVGATVRFERHVVAVVQGGTPGQELVADFLPEVRRDSLLIAPLEAKRVLALFYSNRAVELMAESRIGGGPGVGPPVPRGGPGPGRGLEHPRGGPAVPGAGRRRRGLLPQVPGGGSQGRRSLRESGEPAACPGPRGRGPGLPGTWPGDPEARSVLQCLPGRGGPRRAAVG